MQSVVGILPGFPTESARLHPLVDIVRPFRKLTVFLNDGEELDEDEIYDPGQQMVEFLVEAFARELGERQACVRAIQVDEAPTLLLDIALSARQNLLIREKFGDKAVALVLMVSRHGLSLNDHGGGNGIGEDVCELVNDFVLALLLATFSPRHIEGPMEVCSLVYECLVAQCIYVEEIVVSQIDATQLVIVELHDGQVNCVPLGNDLHEVRGAEVDELSERQVDMLGRAARGIDPGLVFLADSYIAQFEECHDLGKKRRRAPVILAVYNSLFGAEVLRWLLEVASQIHGQFKVGLETLVVALPNQAEVGKDGVGPLLVVLQQLLGLRGLEFDVDTELLGVFHEKLGVV